MEATQTLPGLSARESDGKPSEPLSTCLVMGIRELTLPGSPMAMTRPKFNRKTGFVYRDDVRAARKAEFAQEWLDLGHPAFEHGQALAASIEFVFARPASHFGTGRNAGLLKERFLHARPAGGTNGGDLDNLAKLVLDGLEGFAYPNDAAVAELTLRKRYAGPDEHPHTHLRIRPLT